MTRWEYRILSFYSDNPAANFELAQDLGAQGWELVTIDRQDNWIFKRPLKASSEA